MGELIDGRKIALNIKEDIKEFVKNRASKNFNIPKIASILIGEDGGSIYYMNSQERVAKSLGCDFEKIILKGDITEEEVVTIIKKLNNDKLVHGIMLQLPLPKCLNEKSIISNILPIKDIDCLTYENQGRLYVGDTNYFPCTPNAVISILDDLNVDMEGKEVVVLGRSNVVGKPTTKMLLDRNATVTICHSKTVNLKEVTKRADILIVAIGKPKFVNSEYIKEGAIVIDVGTTPVDGKLIGDVDTGDVISKVSFITPVPGGVGALTTTLLIKNACEALVKNED